MLQCCTDSASKDLSNKESYTEGPLEINLPNGKTTHTYVRVLLLFISDFAPLYSQKRQLTDPIKIYCACCTILYTY